ncbi:dihydrodipicolinate synthase family protein [Saccharothrix obliqua]|uniref:dihydrodipicolinate synthase family protein n=1 Tax=Saccharothrix obliqua TaxID=2861747 RepID=UPI001C5E91B3|nr:dihydrodipicolinate synthase family protein [Saccharothrix obliqua]MBW4719886.1 dihydrodipicolinate synthase family protein [Saccharothrix obliqua]
MTLSGVFVPLVTPFDEAGAVAVDALDRLAREVLDDGATGLVALGTTGEPAALTDAERRTVLDVVGRVCRERSAPLLVGANTRAELVALADSGATAALCAVPAFLRPGEDGVVAHFATLTGPVPLVVYHVPYRTGQPLSAGAIRRLAALPGVVGIKHAVGSVDADTMDLLTNPPADFAVLGGDDVFISPMLALGAHGGILASAHFATRRFADLVDAWHTDPPRARALSAPLTAGAAALFAAPNPTLVKAVLHARGRIPTPAVRLPLLAPDPTLVDAAVRAW